MFYRIYAPKVGLVVVGKLVRKEPLKPDHRRPPVEMNHVLQDNYIMSLQSGGWWLFMKHGCKRWKPNPQSVFPSLGSALPKSISHMENCPRGVCIEICTQITSIVSCILLPQHQFSRCRYCPQNVVSTAASRRAPTSPPGLCSCHGPWISLCCRYWCHPCSRRKLRQR